MMHAKTAVADGRWARVGSTNLNVASWLGNYELDVAVEDRRFAREMEEMYLHDLTHSTEIVLSEQKRVQTIGGRRQKRPHRTGRGGSAGRAAAGALRIGNAVGAAITNHRVLGATEARMMVLVGLALIGFAVVALLWPRVIAVPLAALGLWVALSFLIKAYKLRAGQSDKS
ncbi:MAG: phospholipase D-like domain-containing protein [Pyrinomonadaceae bacterium]